MQFPAFTWVMLAVAGLAGGGYANNAASAEAGIRVELDTDLGAILVEVFPDVAPLSACDFLAYVDAGLYANAADAAFYRVVRLDNDHGEPKIEVVQGGLQDEKQERAPVPHESTQATGLKHVDGALSLARGAVGTGSAAAFFIVIGDQPSLDFGGARNKDRQGFAVFGRVVRGMEIVRRIHQMKANGAVDDPYLKDQLLAKPVAIKGAKRLDARAKVCAAPRG
jgi:peptidyl-prolyl cis-trans isomerase A (cyclophilin A)